MRRTSSTSSRTLKLLIVGNHKPSLRNVDEAIRRRILLVPFTVQIPEAERDPKLAEKLKAEWPAILRWMIDGCLEWQRYGLVVPTIVRDATDEYFADQDTLAQWAEEWLEPERDAFVLSRVPVRIVEAVVRRAEFVGGDGDGLRRWAQGSRV